MLNSFFLKRSHFLKGHYNFLLISLILLFLFRPWNTWFWYPIGWKFLLTAALLCSIFNCGHSKFVKITATALAIPGLILSWIAFLSHGPLVSICAVCLNTLFLILCTFSIIRDVLLKKSVSFEILKGVVCAYLLIAASFSHFYWITEFIIPDSFTMIYKKISIFSYVDYLSEMSYFSLSTIVSMPFGDILPKKSVAETLFVIEGVLGQFYLVLLVARLVSIHSEICLHTTLIHSKKKKSPLFAHYGVLLISLILLYIFRPYDPNKWYLGCWKIILTFVTLSAIFNKESSKPFRLIETILAIPTITFSWLALFFELHWFKLANVAFTSIFMFFCAFSIIRNILNEKEVTFEPLRGAISAYLLVSIGFAYIFWGLEFIDPSTFFVADKTIGLSSPAFLSEMLSFNIISFLAINTGEIIPIRTSAQTLVILNSVLGQFYVAILISRLVSVYTMKNHSGFSKPSSNTK